MVKALELNEKIDPDKQQFKASTAWLKNFQSRHGIHCYSRWAMSANKESVEALKETLSELIEEEGLVFSQAHNCDESGLSGRISLTKLWHHIMKVKHLVQGQ